jgi:hypothetical protein
MGGELLGSDVVTLRVLGAPRAVDATEVAAAHHAGSDATAPISNPGTARASTGAARATLPPAIGNRPPGIFLPYPGMKTAPPD